MDVAFFERLFETASLIARHPDYPGKQRVVDDCRAEVKELTVSGRISAEQGQTLLRILAGVKQPTV
ncbi:hypothetical protein [Tautonia rosea]|uniref:hypothetical protein n=1 Tax=Tautonia rosea TaxID=2728037 RepID=UPI0014742DB5|nr:hypothetical protein [Tautonia rosea]